MATVTTTPVPVRDDGNGVTYTLQDPGAGRDRTVQVRFRDGDGAIVVRIRHGQMTADSDGMVIGRHERNGGATHDTTVIELLPAP